MTQPARLLQALGGKENVRLLESCITRMRAEVVNPALVDEAELINAGAHGVVQAAHDVQIVLGPQADAITADMQELL